MSALCLAVKLGTKKLGFSEEAIPVLRKLDQPAGLKPSLLLLSIAVVAVAAGFAASAAAGPPGSFATPEVRVTPPIVNFGSVAAGATRTRMLSITNVSDHPLLFSSTGIHQPAPYTLFQWRTGLEWPPCPELQGVTRSELMPGDTCELPMSVHPAPDLAAGVHRATFEIDTDYVTGAQLLVVPLTVRVR